MKMCYFDATCGTQSSSRSALQPTTHRSCSSGWVPSRIRMCYTSMNFDEFQADFLPCEFGGGSNLSFWLFRQLHVYVIEKTRLVKNYLVRSKLPSSSRKCPKQTVQAVLSGGCCYRGGLLHVFGISRVFASTSRNTALPPFKQPDPPRISHKGY